MSRRVPVRRRVSDEHKLTRHQGDQRDLRYAAVEQVLKQNLLVDGNRSGGERAADRERWHDVHHILVCPVQRRDKPLGIAAQAVFGAVVDIHL